MFDATYEKDSPVESVLSSDKPIDFVFSHVPPFGLLDRTRDAVTHKQIRNTGSKLLRLIIDKRKPRVAFFGHNHYCNYKFFGDMLVVSVDKFCRKIPKKIESGKSNKNVRDVDGFSYIVITLKDESYVIEIFRRNRLVFQYDMKQHNILYSEL